MNQMLQLVLVMVVFFLLMRQYKKSPQPHVLVTLMALALIAVCRGIVPMIPSQTIKTLIVLLAVIGCVFSYWLIARHERER